MINTDAADNITEELTKLLKHSKDSKRDTLDESDNALIMETPPNDEATKNDKISSKDIINAVSDLRIDTLKILEMLTELNTEMDSIKERLNKLENNEDRESHNDNIENMQEQLDKILSVKLDEFKIKLKKNMRFISKK